MKKGGESSPAHTEQPESPPREYSLYVSDIARGVTDDDLREAFSKIANVYEALIVKNKFTGETKGYGFVRFHSMDDVYSTLDCNSLPRFEDSVSHRVQTVKVTIADPKDTLYIGNIPRGWAEEDVLQILREVGRESPRKFRFAERKTHGYVTYTDHDTAVNALKNIQRPPPGVHSSPFTAYLAPPKFYDSKSAPSMKVLFVRGAGGILHEDLRELFGGSSVVEKVVVPVDSTKRTPLGHAFIHYFSSKHAAAAMSKLNNSEFDGHKLSIEWSLPKSVTRRDTAAFSGVEYPQYLFPYPYSHPYPYYQDFYPPYSYLPYDTYHMESGGLCEYHHSGHDHSSKAERRSSSSSRDVYTTNTYPHHSSLLGLGGKYQKSSRFLPY